MASRSRRLLNQTHAYGVAFASHVVGPDARLYLADVTLMEHHHAETALPDAATN